MVVFLEIFCVFSCSTRWSKRTIIWGIGRSVSAAGLSPVWKVAHWRLPPPLLWAGLLFERVVGGVDARDLVFSSNWARSRVCLVRCLARPCEVTALALTPPARVVRSVSDGVTLGCAVLWMIMLPVSSEGELGAGWSFSICIFEF